MPTGELHGRLAAIPGVLNCTLSEDTVAIVVHPEVDIRLLKARAQVACAELGDRRPLVVAGGQVAPPVGSLSTLGPLSRRAAPIVIGLASLFVLSAVAFVPVNGDGRGPGHRMAPVEQVALSESTVAAPRADRSPFPLGAAPSGVAPSATSGIADLAPVQAVDAGTAGRPEIPSVGFALRLAGGEAVALSPRPAGPTAPAPAGLPAAPEVPPASPPQAAAPPGTAPTPATPPGPAAPDPTLRRSSPTVVAASSEPAPAPTSDVAPPRPTSRAVAVADKAAKSDPPAKPDKPDPPDKPDKADKPDPPAKPDTGHGNPGPKQNRDN